MDRRNSSCVERIRDSRCSLESEKRCHTCTVSESRAKKGKSEEDIGTFLLQRIGSGKAVRDVKRVIGSHRFATLVADSS